MITKPFYKVEGPQKFFKGFFDGFPVWWNALFAFVGTISGSTLCAMNTGNVGLPILVLGLFVCLCMSCSDLLEPKLSDRGLFFFHVSTWASGWYFLKFVLLSAFYLLYLSYRIFCNAIILLFYWRKANACVEKV